MKKSILSIIIIFGVSLAGIAQKSISGIVKDSYGEPLLGATVLVKNTSIGATTGVDGSYNLEVPTITKFIVFSYVGMETKEIEFINQSVINVELDYLLTALDEMVVIGYGSVRKSDLTGSVSKIKTKEIAESQSIDFLNAMQGRMAGVEISSQSGEPGSSINIKIRGANSIVGGSSPLFVIDGVQLDVNINEVASSNSTQASMNPLSTINPSDIESIEVLKDASATAIFGSRGANGVVIITTKTGKSGNSSLEYNGFFGLSEANKQLNVLSAEDYLNYQRLIENENFLLQDSNGDGVLDTSRDFSKIKSHNWQDEALRVAFSSRHEISASGGNDKSNYSAGLGILSQEGIIKNNDYNRYNFRLKVNHRQSDKLKLGFNINSAFSEVTGAVNNGGPDNYNGLVQLLVIANPWEIQDSNIDQSGNEYISPIRLLETADKTTRLMRVIGGVNLEYNITNDLSYINTLGVNYSNSKLKEYYGSDTNWGNAFDGRAAISEVSNQSYNFTSQLNYNKSLNNNNRFDAMVAFEASSYNYEEFRNQIAGFEDESTGVNDISKGAVPLEYSSDRWKTNRLSYLGRANYSLNNKYLFTASFRADGSDKFGKGNRWGYFPSAAFAWKMSEENFMKNIEPVSDLKLRLSYGETGNERIPAYRYFARMENSYYASNNNLMYGLSPASLENPSLKWEVTKQYNAGIDLGFLKNRININIDYYQKQTMDMLLDAPVSSQSGFNTRWMNIGRIDNTGLELNVSTNNIMNKNFSWETNFNISFNQNEVKDLGGADFIPVNIPGGWIQNAGRVIVGAPIGTMYGYEFDGIYQTNDFTWQDNSNPSIPSDERKYILNDDGLIFSGGTPSPGMLKYSDISGPEGVPDGIIDEEYDRTIIGNSNPKHIGGLNNTFKYKNFDLSLFFQWSYGNKIFNASKLREYGLQSFMNINQEYYENYWSETNPTNLFPGLGQIGFTSSSFFVEDGSFLRFKNLTLGYSLSNKLLTNTGLSAVKFFMVGTNLLTWTKYSGFDPEVSSNNPLLPGFERFSYPRSRTINFGVNVKF